MARNFCPKCGGKLEEGAESCLNCGHIFETREYRSVEPVLAKPKKKKGLLWGILLGGFIAIGACALLLVGNKEPQEFRFFDETQCDMTREEVKEYMEEMGYTRKGVVKDLFGQYHDYYEVVFNGYSGVLKIAFSERDSEKRISNCSVEIKLSSDKEFEKAKQSVINYCCEAYGNPLDDGMTWEEDGYSILLSCYPLEVETDNLYAEVMAGTIDILWMKIEE